HTLINNCTFDYNLAFEGGGIYDGSAGVMVIANSRFIDNEAENLGGGIFNRNPNLIVQGSEFRINTAVKTITGGGGAIYNKGPHETASPYFSDCVFHGNTAYGVDGAGAIYNDHSFPTFSHCDFIHNWATYGDGGALINNNSDSTFMSCTFFNNTAENGSAMYNIDKSNVICQNGLFYKNEAHAGGTIASSIGCSALITNCTFFGNSAVRGKAFSFIEGVEISPSDFQLTNCILWDGSGEIFNGDGSVINISYSDIQEGFAGEGNLSVEPLFVSTENNNYRLQIYSPCIDSGTNDPASGLPITDLDNTPRSQDGDSDGSAIADMGAYELPAFTTAYIKFHPEMIDVKVREGFVPDPQFFKITNPGLGTLNWQITEDCPWLEVIPNSGQTVKEEDQVGLLVNTNWLTEGNAYVTDLTITDSQAINSPQTLKVAVKVEIAHHVPLEYPTIQAAINAAQEGDWVVVAPGVYRENIHFTGVNIVVRSIDPADPAIVTSTIIHAIETDSVVTFTGNEDASCLLTGMTISGGKSSSRGGGIRGNFTSATISRCLIRNNVSVDAGGGICDISGLIEYCIITNNTSSYGGAGSVCNGIISNCLIIDNHALVNGGSFNNCDGTIVNCTISSNIADTNGSISSCDGAIINCIVWGNYPAAAYNCMATFSYNCLEWADAGAGNINIDPDFSGEGDYHLLAHSVCIDAGSNNFPALLSSEDIESNQRVVNGDNDQQAIIDMGVYESPFKYSPVIQLSARHFDFEYLTGGSDPPIQTIDIWNRGGDILNWEIIENCDWLSVAPNSGTSTGETVRVNIKLTPSHLEAGRYHHELTISDTTAVNHPRKITVDVHVQTEGQLHVPAEYSTIQAAIDAADENDKVIVAPGIYQENIQVSGKNIELTSEDPYNLAIVANTVIKGDGTASVVIFTGSESSDCRLTGFTITGGFSTKGGGILGNGTLATIDRCVIEHNTATIVGGGLQSCYGIIRHCMIQHNSGGDRGGAMGACIGPIIHCLIHHNTADKGGAFHWCNGDIVNCTITANTSNSQGVLRECHGRVMNSIIWGNSPAGTYSCTAAFEYNCLEWVYAGTGNINIDPDFVSEGDYHLTNDSPGIDMGDPAQDFGMEPLPNGGRINLGVYGNTIEAAITIDSDLDGIDNSQESRWGLDPYKADSDGDGLDDLFEIGFDGDPTDYVPYDPVTGNGADLNAVLSDSDSDGLGDKDELDSHGTNPINRDTDHDLLNDGDEINTYFTDPLDPDHDKDTMRDGWEVFYGFDPTDKSDGDLDLDNDGLINKDEYSLNTKPNNPDSDQDTMSDLWEVIHSLNPLEDDAELDLDNDGFSNIQEFRHFSLPNDPNSLSVVSTFYVDDNGPSDPDPGNSTISDPLENGSPSHPFDAIQEALNIVIAGDTVIVADGDYRENISFSGIDILLMSQNPSDASMVAQTVIRGNGTSSVTFSGSETDACTLSGFTIRGGYSRYGGGISGRGTFATIDRCVIEYNTATVVGGGVHNCQGTISNCV
ncbi:MAG: hypothetical protein GY869_09315, partial [Planctomycetes bacterium]|nr:hypothetical protein [Planctomycetota bacterium]